MIICFPGKISRGKQDWTYSKITTGVAKLLEGGVHWYQQHWSASGTDWNHRECSWKENNIRIFAHRIRKVYYIYSASAGLRSRKYFQLIYIIIIIILIIIIICYLYEVTDSCILDSKTTWANVWPICIQRWWHWMDIDPTSTTVVYLSAMFKVEHCWITLLYLSYFC